MKPPTTDRVDCRPLPTAIAVWVTTLLGVLLTWWLTALGQRRHTGPRNRRLWLGVGLPLLVCGIAVASVITLRLWTLTEDPLRTVAAGEATGNFRIESKDPAVPR